MTRPLVPALLLLLAVAAGGAAAARGLADRFDHEEHAKLFPTCTSCHAGVYAGRDSLFPAPRTCASCHDGRIERRVDWRPRDSLPRTNLRFTHPAHRRAVAEGRGADSVPACTACHTERGAPRMRVRLAVADNCVSCHRLEGEHLAVADTACATCHVPLPEAARLARADVENFPAPPSHESDDFIRKHGSLAAVPGRPDAVRRSCATCHARDFCLTCHVDAPEQRVIQALAPDPRSVRRTTALAEPPSHRAPDFIRRHGSQAGQNGRTCASCHTQESCAACHVTQPRAVQALRTAGEGRAAGARVERRRPADHGADFSEVHNTAATAAPRRCEGCHARVECLDCHRPSPGSAGGEYHPVGYLTRHPSEAWSRETRCADCHNTRAFCADCHAAAGLVAQGGALRPGYHDAQRAFLVGHGQAARQSLESCVSCHAERDCLTCHSAQQGRRLSPHGPGFDADRMRRKNSQTCTVCHGSAIPSVEDGEGE